MNLSALIQLVEPTISDAEDEQNKFEQTDCCICLEPLAPLEPREGKGGEAVRCQVSLSCGHLYHEACIAEWVTRKRDTCPVCRDVITLLHTDNEREEREMVMRVLDAVIRAHSGKPIMTLLLDIAQLFIDAQNDSRNQISVTYLVGRIVNVLLDCPVLSDECKTEMQRLRNHIVPLSPIRAGIMDVAYESVWPSVFAAMKGE